MFGYSERERVMKQIMDFVANGRMPGDYLEFGVFRGGTFAPAYHFASRRALPHMRFYAFDSFQGLPPSEGVDVEADGGAHVQNDTIISFDDWNCFRGDPDRGEKRAFREWLEKHPDITATEFHRFDWCGAAFILHRAELASG